MWKKLLACFLALSLAVSCFGESASEIIKELMEANLEMEIQINELMMYSEKITSDYIESLSMQIAQNENLTNLNKEAKMQLQEAKRRERRLKNGLIITGTISVVSIIYTLANVTR